MYIALFYCIMEAWVNLALVGVVCILYINMKSIRIIQFMFRI